MGGIVLGGWKGVRKVAPSWIEFRQLPQADEIALPVWLYSQPWVRYHTVFGTTLHVSS